MKRISVLKNFSEFPALRHCDISDKSGEEFYHKVLNQEFNECYKAKEILEVDLDNTAGYASSFLDEAFGNLVYDFTLKVVEEYVKIISEQEPHWKTMIENQTYVQWETRRKESQNPKVTRKHDPWYRLVGTETIQKEWESPAAATA